MVDRKMNFMPKLVLAVCVAASIIMVAIYFRQILQNFFCTAGQTIFILIVASFILTAFLKRKYAIASFIIFVSVIIVGGRIVLSSVDIKEYAYKQSCCQNLEGLGKAIKHYEKVYGMMPVGSNWCDALIEKTDVLPREFVCKKTGEVNGESSYTMNKAVVGKSSKDIAADEVVLFETKWPRCGERDASIKVRDFYINGDPNVRDMVAERVYKDRWNQVGGREMMTFETHKDCCNVLFGDGHVKSVKKEDAGKLSWGTVD